MLIGACIPMLCQIWGFRHHRDKHGLALGALFSVGTGYNVEYTRYGNFDIILDDLLGMLELCATPYALWAVLYVVAMLIGCVFTSWPCSLDACWCLQSDFTTDSPHQAGRRALLQVGHL